MHTISSHSLKNPLSLLVLAAAMLPALFAPNAQAAAPAFKYKIETVPAAANASSLQDGSTSAKAVVKIVGCNGRCPHALTIPSQIKGYPVASIGTSAFAGSQIATVTLPSSLQTIGDTAFVGNNIKQVVVPASVSSIGYYAFGRNLLNRVVLQNNNITTRTSGCVHQIQQGKLAVPAGQTVLDSRAFAEQGAARFLVGGVETDWNTLRSQSFVAGC